MVDDVVELLGVGAAEPEDDTPVAVRGDLGRDGGAGSRASGAIFGFARAGEGEHDVVGDDRPAVVPARAGVQLDRQRERIEPLPAPRQRGLKAPLVGGAAVGAEIGKAEEELVAQLLVGRGGLRALHGRGHRRRRVLAGDDHHGARGPRLRRDVAGGERADDGAYRRGSASDQRELLGSGWLLKS